MAPTIACVGDAFEVKVLTEYVPQPGEEFTFLVCAPAFDPRSRRTNVITVHAPASVKSVPMQDPESESEVHSVVLQLAAFPRAGYFDWRLVAIDESGSARAVPVSPQD